MYLVIVKPKNLSVNNKGCEKQKEASKGSGSVAIIHCCNIAAAYLQVCLDMLV